MDETVSNRPGSRYGPRAIRQADEASGLPPSRPHMLLGVDPFAVLNVVDYGDAETVPGDTARSHDAIRQRVAEICAAGAIPVVLGGDHSIADPNIDGGRRPLRPRNRRRHPLRRARRHGRAISPASSARTARRCGWSSIAARFRAIGSCRSACAGSGPSLPSSQWMREVGFRWWTAYELDERGFDVCLDGGDRGRARLGARVPVDRHRRARPRLRARHGHAGARRAHDARARPRDPAHHRRAAGLRDRARRGRAGLRPERQHHGDRGNNLVLEALSGLALRRSGLPARPELDGRARLTPASPSSG